MEELARDDAVCRAERRLRAWGVEESSAYCVAEHLVESDLAGHPSHGLRQLLRYRDLIDAGDCNASAVPVVLSRTGPVAKIDGQAGLGHPAMKLAVDTATELARQFKVGVAGVVRAGHTGRMGAWVEQATAAGMFGIALLAGGDPPWALAAAPGADPVLRTNPLSVGAPATTDPLILDMAMSVVSESSVVAAAARGERVPEGTFADSRGNLSTNPRDYLDGGALLPAGGYKGFALGVLIEAFCLGLTGADNVGLSPVSGAVVICIDSGAFRDTNDCLRSVESLQARVRASGSSDVHVLAPGDRSRAERKSGVVRVDDDVFVLLQ
jgi:LDH2 family malate/lactate/ureidoglycolate dehydrogenase